MEARIGKRSILMLPWLAHGHVSPFFELTKSLAGRDFHIFFCSTPASLVAFKRKLMKNKILSSHIEFVEIHLPVSPELPPHRHTTNDLPPNLMPSLKQAFDMAAPSFSIILSNLKPDLVIYDFLQPWAPSVALSMDIPAVLFHETSALMVSISTQKFMNPEKDYSMIFPEICFSGYGIRALNKLLCPEKNDEEEEEDVNIKVLECFYRSCDVFLLKSFIEIEGKYIDSLPALLSKKAIPVGPLVHDEEEEETLKSKNFEEWLNGKEISSSILVSFGSEFYLSNESMEEIAHGLELSQVNFIWVIRFPKEEEEDQRMKNNEKKLKLPKGFLERVRERGMVVENWAPQAQILKHPSIGGFMSHCGWSSVLESMKFGVPIIGMPMQLDQPVNSWLVELLGVGVEVHRVDDDGRVSREEVARVIREVVVEKGGEGVRKKMKEMEEMIKKKGDEEIDIVVNELVKLCDKKKNMNNGLQS